VLRGFPENCPPTIALLRIDGGFVAPFAAKLAEAIKPQVKIAAEGMPLEQGTVYLAADPVAHVVVDQWPNGRIRFLDREPVQGFKPSASLLYASMAKAGGKMLGAVLTGMGNDGAQGMKALKAAGGKTFAQDKDTSIVSEAPASAIETGSVDQVLPLPTIAGAILKACQDDA
jgi:two-component system chemotaxis response regulator CheB